MLVMSEMISRCCDCGKRRQRRLRVRVLQPSCPNYSNLASQLGFSSKSKYEIKHLSLLDSLLQQAARLPQSINDWLSIT